MKSTERVLLELCDSDTLPGPILSLPLPSSVALSKVLSKGPPHPLNNCLS